MVDKEKEIVIIDDNNEEELELRDNEKEIEDELESEDNDKKIEENIINDDSNEEELVEKLDLTEEQEDLENEETQKDEEDEQKDEEDEQKDEENEQKDLYVLELEHLNEKYKEIILNLNTQLSELKSNHLKEIIDMKNEINNLYLLKTFKKDTLNEIIMLRESYLRDLRNYEDKELEFFSKDKSLQLIEGIANELETILFNNDVLVTKTNITEDTKFNWREHAIIKTVETDNPDLNGILIKSLGYKYEFEEKVLFKEKVEAYKYTKNEKEETNLDN